MNSAAEVTLHEGGAVSVRTRFRIVRAEPAVLGDPAIAQSNELEFSPSWSCRMLNLGVAIVAIVLLAPLMLIIAGLVKLSSPGPILYTQTRVGIDRRRGDDIRWASRRKIDFGGRLFAIYKFRTMRVNADQAQQVWATPDDTRVTPVGRILRNLRLDELPQLFNVVRGEMNIVGPRPEQPKIFLTLRNEIDTYQARQRVLPGITGWAQVNLKYDTSLDDVREKVRYDLEYIQKQSVLEDIRILLKTIPVMVGQRGAW